jgi:hypothetical protein
VLARLAALLETLNDSVQAGRVDADLLARLGDSDPGARAHQSEQLLAALTGSSLGIP